MPGLKSLKSFWFEEFNPAQTKNETRNKSNAKHYYKINSIEQRGI